jgi:hypothetical protein
VGLIVGWLSHGGQARHLHLPLSGRLRVTECSVDSCSCNADSGCHAGAITIGGHRAHCGTVVQISFRSGLGRTGLVGACRRAECTHNEKLECTAASVRVGAGADVADCLTYEAH